MDSDPITTQNTSFPFWLEFKSQRLHHIRISLKVPQDWWVCLVTFFHGAIRIHIPEQFPGASKDEDGARAMATTAMTAGESKDGGREPPDGYDCQRRQGRRMIGDGGGGWRFQSHSRGGWSQTRGQTWECQAQLSLTRRGKRRVNFHGGGEVKASERFPSVIFSCIYRDREENVQQLNLTYAKHNSLLFLWVTSASYYYFYSRIAWMHFARFFIFITSYCYLLFLLN